MTDWVEADYPTLTAGTRVKLTHPDGSVLYREVIKSDYGNPYILVGAPQAYAASVSIATMADGGWSFWVEAPTTPQLPTEPSTVIRFKSDFAVHQLFRNHLWYDTVTGNHDPKNPDDIAFRGEWEVLEPRNVTAKAVWEALNAHREEHPNDSIKTAWAVIAAEFGVVD